MTDNATAQIRQIWLNYCRHEPTHIVVNWISEQPGNSKIYWGSTPEYGYSSEILEETTLHRIEIPLNLQSERVYYKLVSGDQESATLSFKNYAGLGDSLRIAVIANIGYMKGRLDSLEREVPDLLMTCGDNVPNLHKLCGAGELNCIAPYLELIGRYPALFASTPFMPILGNHDKEIRPRGAEPPAIAVYDTNATAFCKFVELPDKEWVWSFRLPDFDVSFLALDLNHTYDVGTTWQSCHGFTLDSPQYQWYKEQVERNDASILITLMNEKNETVRNMENGIWNEITSFVLGILTGVLTGILTSIVRTHYEMWKRRKEDEEAKRKARPVNVLEDHSGEIKKAVSFGDDEAIVVEPLMQYGKPILIAYTKGRKWKV